VSDLVIELKEVFCVHRTNEGDAAALQGMNLEVAAGEIVCVLGPSGAGKSTLLQLIAGVQSPSAGVVNVLGRDVGRLGSRERSRLRHGQVGFLGQQADSALSPSLPIGDAVALPLALRGVAARARESRVAELLDAARLTARAGALPDELSGGERQRVALCAALAHRPSLLLADEPTGELDDDAAAAVRGLIPELARLHETTVVVVSHDPGTAEIADRTIRIRDGRVVEDRTAGDPAFVIGPGGWLRLPPELLGAAGIGQRAYARAVPGGVIVSPAPSDPVKPAKPRTATAPQGRWTPARAELRTVTFGYRHGGHERRVIASLEHEFASGRMTVVTGRSGTGKTTLLRLIAGLYRADAGEVVIDEQSLQDLDAEQLAALRRRRIGYLPQEPSPVGFLSAQENVALALAVRGWDPGAAASRAALALADAGLATRVRQRASRLSAGEAQRVALARALASARGLLVVDEPTSRLDEASASQVAELLASAAAYDGQTVICATHDPAVITHADEVLALEVHA
jgi:ABC-type lipoprotein export system ATPase subunit